MRRLHRPRITCEDQSKVPIHASHLLSLTMACRLVTVPTGRHPGLFPRPHRLVRVPAQAAGINPAARGPFLAWTPSPPFADGAGRRFRPSAPFADGNSGLLGAAPARTTDAGPASSL